MHSNFTRGLIIGGLIGASVSAIMNSEMMTNKNRRRMMRNGKSLLRKSGHMIGDMVDMFR